MQWVASIFAISCLVGCHAAMEQWAIGGVAGSHPGRAGGMLELSGAAADRSGPAFGVGSRLILTDRVQLLADDWELVAIGPRAYGMRWFGRLGGGIDVGVIDDRFAGGAFAAGALGVVLGSTSCGAVIQASAMYLGRFGSAPGEPFIGLSLGSACAYHESDAR